MIAFGQAVVDVEDFTGIVRSTNKVRPSDARIGLRRFAHVRPCRVPGPRSDERANGCEAATWANVVRLPEWQGKSAGLT